MTYKISKHLVMAVTLLVSLAQAKASDSEYSLKLGIGSGDAEMSSVHIGKRWSEPNDEFSALQLTLSTRNMNQLTATEYHLDPVEGEPGNYIVSDVVDIEYGSQNAEGLTLGITKEEGAYFGENNQMYFSAQYGLGVLQVTDDEGDQTSVEANFGFNFGMMLKAGSRMRFDAGVGCGLVQVLGSIENYEDKVEHCKISINTLFK